MKLVRNLFAGLTSSIWSALIGFAVIPFYLKYLGIEAYGLIGFFVTTQVVLSLLDLGMAPTINREVARCSASGKLQKAGKLLHTLAVVYWSIAGAIALLIYALAPFIAEYWLQSKQFTLETITQVIMLMGLVVACRWPIGLYQGALIGAEHLTVSSRINIMMVTISSLGAVTVLAWISSTIEAFFIWQACVGFIHAIFMRLAAWRIIGKSTQNHFDINTLKRVWRFSAGMSSVAVLGLILMQLDKVLLSRILSLESFGQYSLASVVAGSLYVLLTPTFNVIYPRFSALVATNETHKLIDLYHIGTRLFLAVLFPSAIAIAMNSEALLFLWTGNAEIAMSSAPIVSLLIMGTACNGVMHFPYALQLAYGKTSIAVTILTTLIVIMVPMIFYLTRIYGAIGGGLSWLLLNCIYLLFGTWLTHRHLLKGVALHWLISDVGMSFCISWIVIVGGGKWMYIEGNHLMNLSICCILVFISIGLCLATAYPKERWKQVLVEQLSRLKKDV